MDGTVVAATMNHHPTIATARTVDPTNFATFSEGDNAELNQKHPQKDQVDDWEFECRARKTLSEAIALITDNKIISTSPSSSSSFSSLSTSSSSSSSNGAGTAYREALRRTPHLVETESDPMRFLRFEKFNAWDAALRLVSYWEERKNAFGPDRYLYPLTLTGGTSALTLEAIRELRQGTLLLLPNDQNGRSVVCCDQSRFRELNRQVRLQLIFYANFITMRNEQSQTDGMVILWNMATIDQYTPDIIAHANIMRKIMPVRAHSIHVLTPAPTGGVNIDPIRLRFCLWFANQNTWLHQCQTPEERAVKLSAFGFSKDRLPEFLGGSWEVVQWDGVGQEYYCNDTLDNHQNLKKHHDGAAIAVPTTMANSNSNSNSNNNDSIALSDSHSSVVSLNSNMDNGDARRCRIRVEQPHSNNNNQGNLVLPLACSLPEFDNTNDDHASSSSSLSNHPAPAIATTATVINTAKHHYCHIPKDACASSGAERLPRDADVLFGKGRASYRHPGNKNFRRAIEWYSKQYDETRNTCQKMQIRKAIFDSIRNPSSDSNGGYEGGRFLKYNHKNGTWCEVEAEIADKKIAQTLRNHRKR